MKFSPRSMIRRTCMLAAALLAMPWLASCGGGGEAGVDPGIVKIPIAYIKRPIPVDENNEAVQVDLRDPLFFVEGGDVYIRESTLASSETINITESITNGEGDVKGLNASFDGSKLIFSLRQVDPDPDDDVVPPLGYLSIRRAIAITYPLDGRGWR